MINKPPFLPCLLNRLLDNEPKKQQEPWDKFHYGQNKMRTLIQQNIIDILNNTNIESQLDPVHHNNVVESVLNYGVAPLMGNYIGAQQWKILEQSVRAALIRFESRLRPHSLMLILEGDKRSPSCNGIISFNIRALVYWSPQPFDLSLRARYDTETEVTTVTAA